MGFGVALMDGVDAQEAGLAARVGPPPFGDRDRAGAGFVEVQVMAAVGGAAPQVVDGRGRDCRQALVLAFAMDVEFAPEDAAQGRAGESFVGGVRGRQQGDILLAVAARKVAPAGLAQRHGAARTVAADQACQLRQAASAEFDKIAPRGALVFLRQSQVVLGP